MPFDMITLAIDFLGAADNAASTIQGIGRNAARAAAIIIVIIAYARTKAIVPVFGALLVAGLVLFGTHNDSFLERSTDTTIRSQGE